MGLFNRKIKDWKVRHLAYMAGVGTIILAIGMFYILTQFGYTKISVVRSSLLGNIETRSLPISPQILETDPSQFDKTLKQVDRIIYTFKNGGKLSYHSNNIGIPAPKDKNLIASLSRLESAWKTYKSALLNWQSDGFDKAFRNKPINDSYALFIGQAQSAQDAVAQLLAKEKRRKNIATVSILTYVVLLIIFIFLIMRYLILGPLFKVSLASRELAKGNLTQKIKFNARNEIGYMAQNTNALADILKNATDFTKRIGNGELDADYSNLDEEENALAASLLQMRDQMKQTAKSDKERAWVTEGLATFADILRKNNDNIEELSFIVISNIVKYVGASQGAIYILTQPQYDEEEAKIKMEAAYAYERRKRLNIEFNIGEGLVGQVVQEADKLYLTEVPEDYIDIKSGLGETLPRAVLIVPLIINEQVKGVLELASIAEIPPYKIEFVEKLGENIAATIANTKTNERTRSLLKESQSMTEQMRAQEEEMRQNMEEMEATQEEMARAQAEMELKETSLNALINNTTDSIILIDKDYTIVVMNQVIKNRYKGTQYEIMQEGTNALDMLGDVRDEWKAYYDRAFEGERLSFIIKSTVAGENSFRQYNINPVIATTGNITGASIFSRDITKEKQLEQETAAANDKLKRRESVMDAMINNTEDTFLAVDTDYKIIIYNGVLEKNFKQAGIRLEQGVSLLDLLPDKLAQQWKAFFDKALAGENIKIEENREIPKSDVMIETRCEPITNDEDIVIGISIVSTDITAQKRAEAEIGQLKQRIERLTNR